MPDTAAPLREPKQLDIPEEALEAFDHLAEHPTEQGRQQFTSELLRALHEAAVRNDLAPVQYVVESWYRTLLFMAEPNTEALLEWAETCDVSDAKTVEELRASWGV